MKKFALAAGMAAALMCSTSAFATDLEVTHWWTSGGEAAAVAEFAKAFDASGDKWVDGAIAGSSDVARPLIISRILGGNPMGATQLNTGRDAEDLIKAGLMTDLTDLAKQEGWYDIVRPAKLMESCEFEGRLYCVPVNIHSWQWLWLSRAAFEKAGLEVPTDWNQYVADFPKLREAGIIPFALAQGWPTNGIFGVLLAGVGGTDLFLAVNRDKSVDAVKGEDFRAVAQAYADLREVVDVNETVGQWNEAIAQVVSDTAAGNIMGDWAQGEFAVAGEVAGTDYDCLPGLGLNKVLDTGGDAFYFPKNSDPEVTAAQLRLAALMLSPDVQVAFNLKKGSLPIRGDVNLDAANSCMKKGLEILADPNGVLPAGEQLLSSDTQQQLQDLEVEFFSDKAMSVDDFVAQFADIMAQAS